MCFDGNVHQEIKKENSPSFLSWIEFFYWYTEKKQHFTKKGSYFFLQTSFFPRSIFSVRLEPTPPLANVLHRLTIMNRHFSVFSYSAELGMILKNLLPTGSTHKKNLSHLIVSMDKSFSLNLWFFQNNHIIFWRSWENIPPEKRTEIHTIIAETLRYGEKLYGESTHKVVIFWEPKDFPDVLSEHFPLGLFFHGDTLVAFLEKEGIPLTQDLSIFHTLVLWNRTPHYKLRMSYRWKDLLRFSTFKKWIPYREYVLAFFLSLSFVCATAQWYSLKAIQKKYIERKQDLYNVHKKISVFPFSHKEAHGTDEMRTKQVMQEKNLQAFFTTLENFVGENCALEEIVLQKDRATIIFHYGVPLTIHEYHKEWSRFFPRLSPVFFPFKTGVKIECPSPLALEKNITLEAS